MKTKVILQLQVIVFVWLAVSSLMVRAQSSSLIIQGEQATFIKLEEAMGCMSFKISPNGKYVVGYGPSMVSFFYDVEKDETQFNVYPSFVAEEVADDGTMAGNIHYKSGNLSWNFPAMLKDGVLTEMIPAYPGHDPQDASMMYRSYGVWGMSGDGKTVSLAGFTRNNNRAAAYKGATWENGEFKHFLEPSYPNCNEFRATAMSADGNVTVGWANGGGFTGRDAHVWYGKTGYPIPGYTELKATNADGSILGAVNALFYKTEDGFTEELLELYPGWDRCTVMGIADDGLVVGFLNGANAGAYDAMVWTRNTGMLHLKVFLEELYGLTLGNEHFMYASAIYSVSSDGKTLAGYIEYPDNYFYYPVVIQLGETTINSRPMTVTAKQKGQELSVDVKWYKPYHNGRTVLGYNVYRDNVKLNDKLLSEPSFTDNAVTEGAYSYTATAVYETGESKHSKPAQIKVVGADGCYGINSIRTDVVYNKEVSVRWGLPSSQVNTKEERLRNYRDGGASEAFFEEHFTETGSQEIYRVASSTEEEEKRPKSKGEKLDYVQHLDMMSGDRCSFLQYKESYYSGRISNNKLAKFDLYGNFIKEFTIEGVEYGLSSLAADGVYLYGAAEKGSVIYVLEPEAERLVKTITLADSIKISHMTYIPSLNGNRGGFEVGSFSSSHLIDKSGNYLSKGMPVSRCTGTAYFDGKIYAHEQAGEYSGRIVAFDLATKQPTGTVIEYMDDPRLVPLMIYGGAAAGLSLAELDDGTICLLPVYQLGYQNNIVVFLELKSNPDLIGYHLYRNGVKMNQEPLKSRVFTHTIAEPGQYAYTVAAEFEGGCVSELSAPALVTINPLGECFPVKNFTVKEINKDVFLNYEAPDGNPDSQLVGYNIYRNEVKLNTEGFFFEQFYIDNAVELGKEYTYRIECFYDNSCTASETATIIPDGQGTCEAANKLKLESTLINNRQYNVTADWELPYYEAPYPLYYGSAIPVNAIGVQDGRSLTVAVVWTIEKLEMYKDFSVAGLEFYVADEAAIKPIVIADEVIVFHEELEEYQDLIPESYNTFMLETPIPISSLDMEIAVGYTAVYETGAMPYGLSSGAVVPGWGDLFSETPENMRTWYRGAELLGMKNNWAISALLIRNREVEDGKTAKDAASVSTKGLVRLSGDNRPTTPLPALNTEPVNTYSPASNATQLLGFNVYRNENKLNDTPVKSTSYIDEDVPGGGTYSYRVYTVWNVCDEVGGESASITLEPIVGIGDASEDAVQVYPNPASGLLYLKGLFSKGEIMDVTGCVLKKIPENAPSVSLEGMTPGIYFIRLTLPDNNVVVRKIMVQ